MKKSKPIYLLFALFLLLVQPGCRKEINDDSGGRKTMSQLNVSPAFNWETSHEVNLTVAVDLPEAIGSLSRIAVYNGNPLNNGLLLLNGSAGYNYPFTNKVRIPTAVTQLFLQLTTQAGVTEIVAVDVHNDISYTFSGTKPSYKNGAEIAEPDCFSGCTVSLSGSGNTSMTSGKTYCVTGSYSGTVISGSGGGNLKVCGTANLSLLKVNTAGCNIIVTTGGVLTIDSLYMSSTSTLTVYQTGHISIRGFYMAINSKIVNYSNDFVFSSRFTFNGEIQNFGTMTLQSDCELNGSGGKLTNSGIFNVAGWFKANALSLTNNGTIEVANYIHLNTPTAVVNNCKIIAHANVHVFGATLTMNNGYIAGDQEIHFTPYATVILQNQSMISTLEFNMESNVTAQGGKSSIKVTGPANLLNTSKKFDGPVELATTSGTITGGTSSNFINGASISTIAGATNYIPPSACNPQGIGNPAPPDNDGDGVPDNLDEFPADASRAYTNFYPARNQFGSLGFEDLWPGKGDYDMNDLVVDYNFKIVSNGQNKIVEIMPTFYVRAVGATLQNGFGFQFDNLQPADVSSVTGNSIKMGYISTNANGTENNQGHAVIIAFDNAENVIHRVGGSFYNTMKNEPYGTSDSISMVIHFSTPQESSAVGTPPYNPFLIKNMERGVEIHMPDRVPTSLADASYFGSGDDDSKPGNGRYYKTKNNLPWAINIPVRFDYTWELVPVINGHLLFGTWAESSGASYPGWYLNQAGYRDATQIYSKPATR